MLELIKRDIKELNWRKFYFSSKGRVARYQYNLYLILPYVLINWLLMKGQKIFMGSISELIAFTLFSLVVSLVIIWPLIVVTNKRLHDRGASGWRQVIYIGLATAGGIVMIMGAQINPNNMSFVTTDPFKYYGGMVLSIIATVGFLIDIMALPGSSKDNKYGQDPLKPINLKRSNEVKARLKQAKENE